MTSAIKYGLEGLAAVSSTAFGTGTLLATWGAWTPTEAFAGVGLMITGVSILVRQVWASAVRESRTDSRLESIEKALGEAKDGEEKRRELLNGQLAELDRRLREQSERLNDAIERYEKRRRRP